jgi:hypothetical protein
MIAREAGGIGMKNTSSWSWSYLKTLLTKKKEYANEDYIAVMWPVAYPNPLEPSGGTYLSPKDPHCTIIMLGTTDVATFTKEEVLFVIRSIPSWNSMVYATVTELEWFGENKDIPVLRVEHTLLETFHDQLEEGLAAVGIKNTSSFPEYKPHVTITPEIVDSNTMPRRLLLGPVELWWGGERIRVDG